MLPKGQIGEDLNSNRIFRLDVVDDGLDEVVVDVVVVERLVVDGQDVNLVVAHADGF